MWQPYNGFEVFEPGSWTDAIEDPSVFVDMNPPTLAKKGGATARIGCTDDGFPKNKTDTSEDTFHDLKTSQEDLKRARSKVPGASHRGSHFSNMSAKLNGFLNKYPNTKECHLWEAKQLQQFQLLMLMMRSAGIDDIYRETGDRRQLRGDEHT